VGNISRNARSEDVEKEFKNHGPCRLKFKGSFAFIEYDEERDAEDALKSLQNKSIGGREINIEWSKNSGRFDPAKSKRRRKRSSSPKKRDIRDERCYKCGHRGHFAYDCREYSSRRHRHSKSRSRSRKHRKRSDSRKRHRSRSSRSPDDRKKRTEKKRSPSKSKSKSKSGSSPSRSSPKRVDKSPVRDLPSEENNIKTIKKDSPSNERKKDVKMEESKDRIIEEIFKDEENKNNNDYDKKQEKETVSNDNTAAEIKTEGNGDSKDEVYGKMKVDELKAELKKRNLQFNTKDRKSDLISLLKSNDTSKA